MSHHGGHGYPRTQQIMEEKRRAAEQQQKEYNEKYPTLQAKLAALPPTGASRQRARLEAAIQKEGETKKAAQFVAAAKAEAKAAKQASKKENKS